MSLRKTPFVSGEYYHIYNRGNSKQKIYHDIEDYYRFRALLYTCNSENNFRMSSVIENANKNPYLWDRGEQLVSIGAYCLMPNHFHILITENKKGGISLFMQKLLTAYVMYYNHKYERAGGLFEGKFRSEYLGLDQYLKYIFSYIHLNPIKLIQTDWKEVGIKNVEEALTYLDNYEHSSYPDFKGIERKENIILNRKAYPNYFSSIKNFEKEILDWMNYSDLS
ncbi:MAG: transposase [Patescibacteria group bacterium]